MASSSNPSVTAKLQANPVGRRVLRGLGLILPPILTIVIFVWIGSTIQAYVLTPITRGAEELLVWSMTDVREWPPGADPRAETISIQGERWVRLESGQSIPQYVVEWLQEHAAAEPLPASGTAAWRQYVVSRYLQPHVVVPVFLLGFILFLYVLGKFLAAGVANLLERAIYRLPLIRSVYSSVKQVTDFLFVDGRIQYKRVVAVQYPRRGVWTVGLVTGEGVPDVNAAANEGCVTVMLPCSPMPATGYAIVVPRSEAHDLNISVDQALQFLVSCGVVTPPPAVAAAASQARGARLDQPDSPIATATALPPEARPR